MDTSSPTGLPLQPASSTAVLERHAAGVTITVPPAGLRGVGCAFLVRTLFWNAMIWPFAVIFYYYAITRAPVFDDRPASFLWCLFPVPFVLIAAATLAYLIHLMRRQAVLAVVGDRLIVCYVTPFGTFRGEWPAEQLVAIGTRATSEDDDSPGQLALQVLPKGGPPFEFLSGRGDAEVRWLADALRRALRLDPSAAALAPADDDHAGLFPE